MIVSSKVNLPDDDMLSEAPPAYDATEHHDATVLSADEKPPQATSRTAILHQVAQAVAQNISATSTAAAIFKVLPTPRRDTLVVRWLSLNQRVRTAQEVKEKVITILRDMVKQGTMTSSVPLMLSSCAETCRAHGLSLSSALQEPSVEGHSLLYWVVVKHITEPEKPSPPDMLPELISTFLSFAAPLSNVTRSELYLACLQNDDHALFQALQRSTIFTPVSGPDEILFGGVVPSDDIRIHNVDGGAFVAYVRIPMFQTRMRVSKHIDLRFIARGRLWSLKFLVASANNHHLRPIASPGTWVATLSLLEHSPPTFVDAQLIIDCAHIHDPFAALSTIAASSGNDPILGVGRALAKSAIVMSLRTGNVQLSSEGPCSHIAAPFAEGSVVNVLQHRRSIYIAPDGSLQIRLEAELAVSGMHSA